MQQAIKPVTTVLNENYRKQLSTNEYQLILNPHEELSNKIRQIRAAFAEAYDAPSAQAGKPNLTLLRFTQLTLMEERIVQRLRTIAMGYCPFKVELKDFGSLPTHSIFIQVTSKLPIRALVKEIRDVQRLMKLDKDSETKAMDFLKEKGHGTHVAVEASKNDDGTLSVATIEPAKKEDKKAEKTETK